MKLLVIFIASAVFFACGDASSTSVNQSNSTSATGNGSAGVAETGASVPEATPEAATLKGEPRTVTEFFALLPEKYFVLEGCDKATDKNCEKARAEYLKMSGSMVDVKNGYLKGGCDGGQACIEMAIFKKPDSTYIVGIHTWAEMNNDFHFLDYAGGKWNDVSATAIPEFSKRNWYEIPRVGTTMKVYAKKIEEQGDDYEVSDQGALLYSLNWKDGKFSK
jgi:hypothetical protein